MKGNKIRLFEAQAARDSAHFRGIELKAFKIAGPSRPVSPPFRCWLVSLDEANVLVGGDRPNEGACRLNHASLELERFSARPPPATD